MLLTYYNLLHASVSQVHTWTVHIQVLSRFQVLSRLKVNFRHYIWYVCIGFLPVFKTESLQVSEVKFKPYLPYRWYLKQAGPYSRGPTSTFATRDLVAKVDVGPQLYGPPMTYAHFWAVSTVFHLISTNFVLITSIITFPSSRRSASRALPAIPWSQPSLL